MTQSIFEAYNQAKKELAEAGIEDYGFEARQMIRRVTGLSNQQILERYQQPLTEFQQNNLTAMLKQRSIRYPLQYMFGEWGFYGRDFYVGVGALIPRPDTETLVEQALKILEKTEQPEVLDLCAGTGCIGITLAAERKDSFVTLVEKYPEAMGYLTRNIERNGVPNTRALTGDIFEKIGADRLYDIIVSNPPYIPAEEMETVSPEVHFEPQEALYGGEDGLMFYRAITENYRDALKTGGTLMFEVGIGEAAAVSAVLAENGFTEIAVQKDYGGIDRVVSGVKP